MSFKFLPSPHATSIVHLPTYCMGKLVYRTLTWATERKRKTCIHTTTWKSVPLPPELPETVALLYCYLSWLLREPLKQTTSPITTRLLGKQWPPFPLYALPYTVASGPMYPLFSLRTPNPKGALLAPSPSPFSVSTLPAIWPLCKASASSSLQGMREKRKSTSCPVFCFFFFLWGDPIHSTVSLPGPWL